MHYMSTLVFQNLSETTTTTTIKLKLAAPPPEKSNKLLPNEFENRGCFDFLQTTPKESGDYFYPCPKQSSFPSLSAKSLELCTENLGSETGSDASSDDGAAAAAIFSTASAPPSIPSPNSTPFRNSNWKHITRFPKFSDHEFPPPLTSSLQVRRRREGGRLIIEAVEAPFRNSYLQAERSDGRLRISRLD